MTEIKIKPLSVNKAWQGRRYKTQEYKAYEQELMYLLPNMEIPEGNLKLKMRVGYRNKLSDLDNFVKPFVDVIQKKYGFNDNRIYKLELEKEITKDEFIQFSIEELNK